MKVDERILKLAENVLKNSGHDSDSGGHPFRNGTRRRRIRQHGQKIKRRIVYYGTGTNQYQRH